MTTPIPADLLEILADPETHEPVELASAKQLTALNKAVKAGTAKRRDGQPLDSDAGDGDSGIEAALLSQGGKVAYPVRDGIANFLIEERIELSEAL
jgi:uncharacterized protein YbaR (Trm112 family)